MRRRIIGFHEDTEGHWVADLECGHAQHVRHEPPWQERSWVPDAGRPRGHDRNLSRLRPLRRGEPEERAAAQAEQSRTWVTVKSQDIGDSD
jgi:hypothetical protein